MVKLTESEEKTLSALKDALKDSEMANKIITAQYLLSEIEFQFGHDIAEFMVGYRNGLNQSNGEFTRGEIPLFAKAGHYASDGYGKFFDEVNGLMCDLDNDLNIFAHSTETKELSKAVGNLVKAKKRPWIDNYNELKKTR